jgi:hypothetical protein
VSSQLYDVTDKRDPSAAAAQHTCPAIPWHQKGWFRVLLGCGVMLIGFSRLCKGLVLLTGATNYGILLEVNHGELYYTAAVSQEDAKRLGAFLVQEKIFDGRPISMQLTKKGETAQLCFPVKPGFEKDAAYVASVHDLGVQISQQVFQGAPVEVHLCDNELKTLRVVPATVTAK